MHTSNLSISKRFFFVANSSRSRTCFCRDSTYPWWASCISNRGAQACCSSSLVHLLRDSTFCSCSINSDLVWVSKWSLFPSRWDFATFAVLEFLKIDSLLPKTSTGCSLSLWKCVLIQPSLMWKQCNKFSCAHEVQTLRWTGYQGFFFRVINLRSFRTCFSLR